GATASATGTGTRTLGTIGAAGTRSARTRRVRVVPWRGMVGREAHRAARMAIGMGGLASIALASAGTTTARAGALLAGARLARATAVGVAMSGRTGIDALGHVPGAERGRVAFRQRLGSLLRALLERLLRLLGRLLAADREATVRLLAAAPATILAHMVEAAQLAPLVGGVVAVDVALRTAVAAHVHGRLGGLALADHRQQGQRRRRAFLELELLAQHVDLRIGQLQRLPAQQRLRQRDVAVANALEPADLATLRFPQAADLAVAAFLEQ